MDDVILGDSLLPREAWPQRRATLLRTFTDTVYGHTPPGGRVHSLERVSEERHVLGGRADRLRFRFVVACPQGDLPVDLLVHTPADTARTRPAPVFLGLNFDGNDGTIAGEQSRRWPYARAAERGYAVATACYQQLEPDAAGATSGARSLFPDDSWGAVAAWSWGLSRCLDAVDAIDVLDADRTIVLGHSRLGKAALWAAAQDDRFAGAISNNSGCAGASLFRHPGGEDIAAITQHFPHWFAPRFESYANAEQRLPIDQHQLLAIIAPRPLHVASASRDHWADPEGERLAVEAAAPVFRLLGGEEALSYHLRDGDHDMLREDWEHFLAFADRSLR
ncbi:MAG TPA: hypothetical protein VN133_10210 [Humibacter sp.]|nr:hypothetical protein [Humibacter sp.]